MSRNVNGVVFDLDGTLLDTREVIAGVLRDVLRSFGVIVSFEEMLRRAHLSPYRIIREYNREYNPFLSSISPKSKSVSQISFFFPPSSSNVVLLCTPATLTGSIISPKAPKAKAESIPIAANAFEAIISIKNPITKAISTTAAPV